MGSAFGAGSGADMLQEILRQKFTEAIQQQAMQQAQVRDQAALKHYGAMEQEATAQTDMQRKRLDAELNPPPAPPLPPRRHVVGGHLLDDEGAQLDKSPEPQPEAMQQVTRIVNGKLVNIGSVPKGTRIVSTPKEAGGGAGPNQAPAQTPQQQNEVTDAIKLIDQIGADPALTTAVGPLDQYIGKARDLTGVTRFRQLHDQLVGKLALAQAGKLKGQGQISDKERALLSAAATALSQGLSEQDYKNELGKIRGQFERMQQPQLAPMPAHGSATPDSGRTYYDMNGNPVKR